MSCLDQGGLATTEISNKGPWYLQIHPGNSLEATCLLREGTPSLMP